MTEAFNALGGASWSARANPTAAAEDPDNDPDKLTFQNQFSVLSIGGADEDDNSDVPSDNDGVSAEKPQKKIARGEGKKGKQTKKSKKSSTKATMEASLVDVSIESYRIVEDTDGLVSDYLLAVYAVTKEWSELRSCIQGLWREVAYDGLNGAVVASLSNIAVCGLYPVDWYNALGHVFFIVDFF